MAGHKPALLGWINTLHGMRSCGWWLVGIVGGICVWCWREVVSRLVPQLIKNEWKEKGEELFLLHCCLLLELFNSHVSGGCSAAPTGHAVYTILNPTAARHCSQVLCNTAPQLLEFSTHHWNMHIKILISEATEAFSCALDSRVKIHGMSTLYSNFIFKGPNMI